MFKLLLSLFLACLSIAHSSAQIDLSSPQSTYDSCHEWIISNNNIDNFKYVATTCFTEKGRAETIIYLLLGASMAIGFQELAREQEGEQASEAKYDELEFDKIVSKYHLSQAFENDKTENIVSIFKQIDTTSLFGELVDFLQINNEKTKRLDDLVITDNKATAIEMSEDKFRWVVSFLRVGDRWLIDGWKQEEIE